MNKKNQNLIRNYFSGRLLQNTEMYGKNQLNDFKGRYFRLHELSIKKYGGSTGVGEEGLLDSAIARPFQTFDGLDLYISTIEKAAAITEGIIINHPFIDGNANWIFSNVGNIKDW